MDTPTINLVITAALLTVALVSVLFALWDVWHLDRAGRKPAPPLNLDTIYRRNPNA